MISEDCCIFIVLRIIELQIIIAMITESKVIELFCMADVFAVFFDVMVSKYTLKPQSDVRPHRFFIYFIHSCFQPSFCFLSASFCSIFCRHSGLCQEKYNENMLYIKQNSD